MADLFPSRLMYPIDDVRCHSDDELAVAPLPIGGPPGQSGGEASTANTTAGHQGTQAPGSTQLPSYSQASGSKGKERQTNDGDESEEEPNAVMSQLAQLTAELELQKKQLTAQAKEIAKQKAAPKRVTTRGSTAPGTSSQIAALELLAAKKKGKKKAAP